MSLLFLQYLVHIARKIRQFREGAYAEEAVRTELKDIRIEASEEEPSKGGNHG
jgi:hypothetical protein